MADFRLINKRFDCVTCEYGYLSCNSQRILDQLREDGTPEHSLACISYKRIAPTPRRVSMAPGEVILSQARRLG